MTGIMAVKLKMAVNYILSKLQRAVILDVKLQSPNGFQYHIGFR